MPRFRIRKQTVWRAHSLLGLVAGLGLLVIGASGSLLMFSREIDGVLRPDVGHGRTGASRLPMDELVGRVASSFRATDCWDGLFSQEIHRSDRVLLKLPDEEPWLHAHIDPYTGKILSRPAESAEHFTGWLLELHYTFLADHAGMLVAGLLAGILVLLGISGLWLYGNFFRNLLRLRWGASARILFSTCTSSSGSCRWSSTSSSDFTGAWWNLSHLIGHLFEEDPPRRRKRPIPFLRGNGPRSMP